MFECLNSLFLLLVGIVAIQVIIAALVGHVGAVAAVHHWMERTRAAPGDYNAHGVPR